MLDEEYTRHPFYGSRRMQVSLGEQGQEVSRKRVRRLMEVMGIEAVYPKPKVSQPGEFVYLAAVMDWCSRYELSWTLSLTMEVDFCVEALKGALRTGRPEIFNSDQGSQFTSEKFRGELEKRGIAISMDGRGRCFDNIFLERLWRSLKYEEIYLKEYGVVPEARAGIGNWFRFYNQERRHQSLGNQPPATVFQRGAA